MEIIFIRHGKCDYTECKKIFKDSENNLAPLSLEGKLQAEEICNNRELDRAELILSSPYTRALQTASIISKNLDLDINIELELHEWLPDKEFKSSINEFKAFKSFVHNNGETNGNTYESKYEIKKRVGNCLKKYMNYQKIIVVTHAEVIRQFVNIDKIKHCKPYKIVI